MTVYSPHALSKSFRPNAAHPQPSSLVGWQLLYMDAVNKSFIDDCRFPSLALKIM
jgi:hypothetical protein